MNYLGEKKEEVSLGNKICLYILGFAMMITLFLRGTVVATNLTQYPWFGSLETTADIFLVFKAKVIIITAIVMVAFIIGNIFMNGFKIKKFMIPLILYVVLTIVSTIISPYKEYGFKGSYEQYESLWVLISYGVILLYTYLFVNSKYAISFSKISLSVLAVIHSVIGITQLVGKDFFATRLGKVFLIPENFPNAAEVRKSLEFTFSNSKNHQVYLTLYNPNYVGAYSALLFPIFTVLAMKGKPHKRIFWGIMALINFLCAMGSGSKTFLGSLLVSFIIGIILLRKKVKRYLPALSVFIIIVVGSAIFYFRSINVSLISYVKNAITAKSEDVLDVKLEKDYVSLTINNEIYNLSYTPVDDNAIIKIQKNGKDVPYKINGSEIRVDEIKDIYFVVGKDANNDTVITCKTPKGSLSFTNKDGYKFYVSIGKLDTLHPVKVAFRGHDAFASGRGYIWSRTIPLLKPLGYGADSFTLVFPQDDYVGKLNGGFNSLIVTKPHNLFLQVGVQSGILALICFILLPLFYVVDSFKLLWKSEFNDLEMFNLGITLGILGYLFAGIFNDSCVALAPLYWIFLGLGFAANKLIKKSL